MLASCRIRDVRLQPSSSEIPFPDDSFDLVTAVCVYHHVPPAERIGLTSEVRRVLKRGGVFAIIEHNPLNPITSFIVRRSPIDVDAQLLSPWLARSLQTQSGLQFTRTEFFLFFPKGLYERLRLAEDLLSWFPLGGQFAAFATKP